MAMDVSGYGVHDMMGNVTEWTSDKLSPYPGNKDSRNANYRRGYISVRGASYAIKGASFKLWTRGAYLPKSQYGIGFRCVRDIETEGGEEATN
jgi:formylglycine-generating enzyme required for sulfatase activity